MDLTKPDMNKECANKLMEFAEEATTILEWGSGGSTICMSKLLQSGTMLFSYEHDTMFYDMIKPKLNEFIIYILAVGDDYVNGPPSDVHYSLILVDGIYRRRCLKRVREELSWDRLLLHDAERERYKIEMNKFTKDKYNTYFVRNLWICEPK
jgi:hypothetical protein